MATTIDKVKHINLGTGGVLKRLTSAAYHSDATDTSITFKHTIITATVGYYMDWNRKTLFGDNGYLKSITARYKFQPSTGSGHKTSVSRGTVASDGDVEFTVIASKTDLGASVHNIEFPNLSGFTLYTNSNGDEVYYVGFSATKSGTSTWYWYFTDIDFEVTYTVPAYTLTVNSNNTAYGTVTGGGDYETGTTATLTATPNDGYKFVKWSDGNTDATRTVTVSADTTYTAEFAEDGVNDMHCDAVQPVQLWADGKQCLQLWADGVKIFG